jgi:polyferredoxin
MNRIDKPRGLVRFASETSIAEGTKHKLNARAIAYSVVLGILIVFVAYLFSVRADVETTVLRAPGTLYQDAGDSYSNLYTIEFVNKTRKEIPVNIKILSGTGEIKMIGQEMIAKKGELTKSMFLVLIDKEDLKTSKNEILFGIYSGEVLIDELESTFVGPNSLDK